MVELNSQRLVPNFQLPSSRGVDVELRDYRHQHPVVLFFAHGAECPRCRQRLRDFADHYADYRFWRTEVLAIIPEPPAIAKQLAEALQLPFSILSDVGGAVREPFMDAAGSADPSDVGLIVLDRFGAPEAWDAAGDADALMAPDEALGWVQHGELACPECGVSEWPAG